jgi:hypothetical protein
MTGIVDRGSPYGPRSQTLPLTLDVAHIIPHNLGEAHDLVEVRIPYFKFLTVENKRRMWKALECFAGPEVRQFLNGPAIDGLENVITLQHDHHNAFGRFNLWFTQDLVWVMGQHLWSSSNKQEGN